VVILFSSDCCNTRRLAGQNAAGVAECVARPAAFGKCRKRPTRKIGRCRKDLRAFSKNGFFRHKGCESRESPWWQALARNCKLGKPENAVSDSLLLTAFFVFRVSSPLEFWLRSALGRMTPQGGTPTAGAPHVGPHAAEAHSH